MQQEGTQFEILNRVDVGGMAEIFRAKNLSNGQIMAIKRILPALADKASFINMFIDEAAVCLALHHPNIVRVDQIGLMDEALFLSMEFVDGANLREVLSFANQYKFSLPVHEALRIAISVLDALDYAHNCCNDEGVPLHLIHRDVSPPNILLGYNGDVKITDFGLVKSKAQISRTVPGLIKGKFSYLSPEAAYGESIDHRSDLYAVGIILWEMLTSRPLFNDPVEMKILDLVRKSIIPSICQLNPQVTPELEAIVLKGLARNRTERYQTAKEFADELRGYLERLGNPKSELGAIVAKIKPPQYSDMSEDNPIIPEGATAADDEVQPHTRSSLIPIEKLRKAAEEQDNASNAPKAEAVPAPADTEPVSSGTVLEQQVPSSDVEDEDTDITVNDMEPAVELPAPNDHSNLIRNALIVLGIILVILIIIVIARAV